MEWRALLEVAHDAWDAHVRDFYLRNGAWPSNDLGVSQALWSLENVDSFDPLSHDGWVYVMGPSEWVRGGDGPPDEPHKIGYSKNPDSRLKQVQTGHPKPLSIAWKARATVGVERAIHDSLAPSRMAGEWFRNDGRTEAVLCHWHYALWMLADAARGSTTLADGSEVLL